MPNKKFSIPQSPEQQEQKARQERIAQRKASKKSSYTNGEVMEAVNDLYEEMVEIKQLLAK
jgi:hypothetical protein